MGLKIKKRRACKKCLPDWLAQFGDLMSLLLVFFILLLSMSVLNEQKVVEYLAHMRRAMGVLNNSSMASVKTITTNERTTPLEKTSQDSQQTQNLVTKAIIQLNRRNKFNKEQENEDMEEDTFATLEVGKKGFTIVLPINVIFKKGEYKLNEEANLFLEELDDILKKYILKNKELKIEVGGYSSLKESSELNTLIFPKNLLELGFLRAESVTNALLNLGINKKYLKTTSYGDDKIFDYKNDAANRRVEITILTDNFDSYLKKHKMNILDK